ncbi:MAG: hypothetical protein ACR2P2_03000 [Nakamurella sp.]
MQVGDRDQQQPVGEVGDLQQHHGVDLVGELADDDAADNGTDRGDAQQQAEAVGGDVQVVLGEQHEGGFGHPTEQTRGGR